MQNDSPVIEPIPSDAIAFCELIGRIIYRCLQEKDARLLVLLKKAADDEPGEHIVTVSKDASE